MRPVVLSSVLHLYPNALANLAVKHFEPIADARFVGCDAERNRYEFEKGGKYFWVEGINIDSSVKLKLKQFGELDEVQAHEVLVNGNYGYEMMELSEVRSEMLVYLYRKKAHFIERTGTVRNWELNSAQFLYLLSQKIDLFNLKEQGFTY